jgi:hypothetical protein
MADSLVIRLEGHRRVIDRLKKHQEAMAPDNPRVKAALTRAAIILVSQAKLNIRGHGLIDEGRLINSIRFEFFRENTVEGVRIGSFGVPYAAFWEFGFSGNMQVRAHARTQTVAFGKRIQPQVVQVAPHTRFRHQEAKPYLRPAYALHRKRITALIQEAYLP